MHDHAVARFDRWSSHYDQSLLQRFLFRPVQEATVAEIAREAGSVHTLLDVGCGTGQLLRRLTTRYPDAELVGVDAAPGMVRQAQGSTGSDGHIGFLNARVENLPFPGGCFDVVVTTVSFHHWADQRRGLQEVRRVLRDRGTFVLTDIVAPGWLRRLIAFRRSDSHFLAREQLDEMLTSEQLQVVRRVSVPWHPHVQMTVAHAVE